MSNDKEEKLKALKLTVDRLEKAYGKGTVMKLGDKQVEAMQQMELYKKYGVYYHPEKEILILQTCWPIGTDWKRLLVYATRP